MMTPEHRSRLRLVHDGRHGDVMNDNFARIFASLVRKKVAAKIEAHEVARRLHVTDGVLASSIHAAEGTLQSGRMLHLVAKLVRVSICGGIVVKQAGAKQVLDSRGVAATQIDDVLAQVPELGDPVDALVRVRERRRISGEFVHAVQVLRYIGHVDPVLEASKGEGRLKHAVDGVLDRLALVEVTLSLRPRLENAGADRVRLEVGGGREGVVELLLGTNLVPGTTIAVKSVSSLGKRLRQSSVVTGSLHVAVDEVRRRHVELRERFLAGQIERFGAGQNAQVQRVCLLHAGEVGVRAIHEHLEIEEHRGIAVRHRLVSFGEGVRSGANPRRRIVARVVTLGHDDNLLALNLLTTGDCQLHLVEHVHALAVDVGTIELGHELRDRRDSRAFVDRKVCLRGGVCKNVRGVEQVGHVVGDDGVILGVDDETEDNHVTLVVDGARVRRAPDALEERLSVQVRVDGSDHGGRNLLRRDGEGRGRRLARLGVRRDVAGRVAVAVLAKVTHLAHVHRPRVGGDVVTHAVDVRELGLDGGSHETCAVHALLALGIRANDIEVVTRAPGETSVARFDVAAPQRRGGVGNVELIGPDGRVGGEDGIVVDRRGLVVNGGVIESQCARRGGIERETLRGADGASVAHQVVRRHVRQRHPGFMKPIDVALLIFPAPQRRNRLDRVREIHEVRAGTQLVVDTVVIDDGRGCDVGDFHANLEIGGGLELVGDVDVEIDDVVNLEPREVGEGGRGRVCGECTG